MTVEGIRNQYPERMQSGETKMELAEPGHSGLVQTVSDIK